MLENIKKSNFAEINLIVLNKNDKSRISIPNFFEKFENKRFVPLPKSFEIKNADELLADVPTLEMSVTNNEQQDQLGGHRKKSSY